MFCTGIKYYTYCFGLSFQNNTQLTSKFSTMKNFHWHFPSRVVQESVIELFTEFKQCEQDDKFQHVLTKIKIL